MEILTQNQIEDVFWRATVDVLGLDPQAEATQGRVRISWPKADTGNSDWSRDENTIFLRITPTYDDYTIQRDIKYKYDSQKDKLKEVVDYHRCFSVQWVCYGPDSAEDADCIKIGILRDNIRAYLRQNGIGIKPNIREPLRNPETDDSGDWWERTDLTAECYILFSRDYDVGIIESVPVTVSSEDTSVDILINAQ